MMGVGVPGRFKAAQAFDAAELREHQQRQVIPASERFVVGIRVVPGNHPGEPPPRNRFKKVSKNAIAVPHARPFYFLSLDNQKVAASRRFGRACPRVTVNHSPDSRARWGRKTKSTARTYFTRVTLKTLALSLMVRL